MKIKFISILLILVFLLSISMPVLAKDKEYIIDEFEVLVDDARIIKILKDQGLNV